ncbi:hypothetical protein PITCH_A1380011 [uncultured Desulfobacterium sp.]|uniref:DUF1573 domain-containing protein n=1 Tax=uncultured Desulfobacterium sp. TaxID=201089 RepID=A0A445MSP1_9BACT|nr:hypothetical protein PITCH_A1380011 [uncultured Desulfobacterium sp.]
MASAKEIPPGGEGKIHITFKTALKSGEKTQAITVNCDDPDNPSISLKVTADIQVSLAATPDRINFGRLKRGVPPLPQYVTLIGNDKDKTEILSVSSNNKNIITEIETLPPKDNKTEKRIKVMVSPDINVGRFREQINIKTSHEKMKELPVFIYGEVMGDIMVFPDNLAFGVFKKGGKYERSVRLRAVSDVTFKLLNVSATTPDLKTEVVTVKEGVEYIVKVTMNEKFDKEYIRGKIIISTDDKVQPTVEIGVFGRAVGEDPAKRATEGAPLIRNKAVSLPNR